HDALPISKAGHYVHEKQYAKPWNHASYPHKSAAHHRREDIPVRMNYGTFTASKTAVKYRGIGDMKARTLAVFLPFICTIALVAQQAQQGARAPEERRLGLGSA